MQNQIYKEALKYVFKIYLNIYLYKLQINSTRMVLMGPVYWYVHLHSMKYPYIYFLSIMYTWSQAVIMKHLPVPLWNQPILDWHYSFKLYVRVKKGINAISNNCLDFQKSQGESLSLAELWNRPYLTNYNLKMKYAFRYKIASVQIWVWNTI